MSNVTLLPGLACDAGLWKHQQEALAPQHEVRVADVHQRFDTLPAMAAALLAETAGPLVLVGASMGGMVALEAARQQPGRVAAIALLGSSARPDTPDLIRLRTEAIRHFEAGRVEEVLMANIAFAFHPEVAQRAGLVADYVAMVRRAGAQQLIRQNRAVMAREDLRPTLPALRCPLLVLCGQADRLTPPEVSQEIAAAVPQARLELVAGAGHMLTMEQPERVNALLLDWLQSLGGGA
jgi:pimeloyl-ACP methyl ester carboxylesterase